MKTVEEKTEKVKSLTWKKLAWRLAVIQCWLYTCSIPNTWLLEMDNTGVKRDVKQQLILWIICTGGGYS